jgi:hypothetical protein
LVEALHACTPVDGAGLGAKRALLILSEIFPIAVSVITLCKSLVKHFAFFSPEELSINLLVQIKLNCISRFLLKTRLLNSQN